MQFHRWLIFASFSLAACNPQLSVQISSGPQRFEIDSASLALPSQLRTSEGTIASVPCTQIACPSSDPIQLACTSGVCDPSPYAFEAPVGSVVDTSMLLRGVGRTLSEVSTIEIVSSAFSTSENSLTLAIPPGELFIGPESAQSTSDAGVSRFGQTGTIAAGSVGPQSLTISSEGTAALSALARSGNGRFRFFVRTSIDLAPGQAFPSGRMVGNVDLTLRVRTNVAI